MRRWKGGSAGMGSGVMGLLSAAGAQGRRLLGLDPAQSGTAGSAAPARAVQVHLPGLWLLVSGLSVVLLVGGAFYLGTLTGPDPIGGRGVAGADPAGVAGTSTTASAETNAGSATEGPVVAMGVDPDVAVDVPGGNFGSAVELPRTDPRVSGLNYLMLVTVRAEDIDEARRLQEFLRQSGVASILSKSNNGRFVSVMDVSRSFTSDEYRAGQHQTHLDRMRALGRAWKRHNGNLGSDLSSMTYYKFKG